ncbi:hypothetical protein A8H38_15640 [Burkholderia thailandensis]|nr:hypothetical protein A8H38_15640 [Burkholderia thailandensis]
MRGDASDAALDRSETEQRVPNSNRRCALSNRPFMKARRFRGMVRFVHFRFPDRQAISHETH